MNVLRVFFGLVFSAVGSTTLAMDIEEEFLDMRPIMAPVLRIQMTGPIEHTDPDKLRTILARYDGTYIRDISVTVDSPGGSLAAGLTMGRILNDRDEIVSSDVANQDGTEAICASACVFLYLGADFRYLSNSGRIGVHQFSSTNPDLDGQSALSTAQTISSLLVSYIQEMRVDVNFFERMTDMPAEGIDFVSESDLVRWNVVTGPVYSETAEYHNINGSLGLRLEHVALHGASTMTLLCGDAGLVGVATLQEPESAAIGDFFLVIDAEPYQLTDWDIVKRAEFRTHVAFQLPDQLRDVVADANSFGARIRTPSKELFYGFEQNIRDEKLRDTITNCKTHQVIPKTETLEPVGSMQVFEDRDIDGNDILRTGIKGISFRQCQIECLAYEYCHAVSYVVKSEWCWPKSGVTSSTKRSGVVSATRY